MEQPAGFSVEVAVAVVVVAVVAVVIVIVIVVELMVGWAAVTLEQRITKKPRTRAAPNRSILFDTVAIAIDGLSQRSDA
jgi:hypothetical protein